MVDLRHVTRDELAVVKTEDFALSESLLGVEKLISSEGGLVSHVAEISDDGAETRIFVTNMGRLEYMHSNIRKTGPNDTGAELGGTGGSDNPRHARAVAVVESIERYSSCVPPGDLPFASFHELGAQAMDVQTLPRCSDAELAVPGTVARRFDPDEKIRWTTARSLTDGREVLVPATLVWLHLPPTSASERAWMQVSTGCAAHSTVSAALVAAISEVIERDAIALTWLQKLPLPPLVLDGNDERLDRVRDEIRKTGREYRFFDATTDLGVPTVYCVDTDPNDTEMMNLVVASTELDPVVAVSKIVRESRSSRVALRNAPPPPSEDGDITSVFHGAQRMGHADLDHVFDFLKVPPRSARRLSDLHVPAGSTSNEHLSWLLKRLDSAGYSVFAVNITTREAEEAGIHVVRVIIPELMPVSFVHQARYLAHPRLYSAPTAMGYSTRDETALNHYPQPFA
ncbi:cytoplasmic protein [Microbacterium sp. UMB0228]|nr:cytoplasmic protein [Microbacterium sp. UMB0228]